MHHYGLAPLDARIAPLRLDRVQGNAEFGPHRAVADILPRWPIPRDGDDANVVALDHGGFHRSDDTCVRGI